MQPEVMVANRNLQFVVFFSYQQLLLLTCLVTIATSTYELTAQLRVAC